MQKNYIIINLKRIISAFLYSFQKIIDILINTEKVNPLVYILKLNRMLLNTAVAIGQKGDGEEEQWW